MVDFTELATDQIGDNGIHRTLRQLIQVYGRLYGTEPYESIKQLRAELQNIKKDQQIFGEEWELFEPIVYQYRTEPISV